MTPYRGTILVVDDTEMNIDFLLSFLSEDYDVSVATNGWDGIDLACSITPDIILLDIVLPDIDGFQVCSCLKDDERTSSIPIIFVTSLEKEVDEARDSGTGAHVQRTGRYVMTIAEYLASKGIKGREISRNEVETLTQASPLHDVGKVGIPDRLLLKPGKLTEEEFEEIKGHGYPTGLKGEEIPLPARIMAVADVYDALRSERP
ncbi:response regulator [Dethiosulfovibrio salsuginis]|uniref:Putative two-component system response regulator n=1 Tax=Dethiosulfovibrio salsuginis TaxID=561720 RepID=A0A1X7IJN0_9BACT|nr:HD domain-containing phosphohydrolase [Dethiosulfovibrio salsuginis]SMG15112.1 putative two-component system response regulator [Dethiosulfovibrio salsuginis]